MQFSRRSRGETRARRDKFKGRLDLPVDGLTLHRGPNVFAGWVLHEWRRLRCVVITVNGHPHTLTTHFYDRPDLSERWPDAPTVGTAAWMVTVDLAGLETDDVVVSAYAVLEPRRRLTQDDRPRLGPVRYIGTARCRLTGRLAQFHQPPTLLAGPARVEGVVRSAREVATVEIRRDGEAVGLARTTPVPALDPTSRGTTRFDHVVTVAPDAATVTLSGTVRLVDGGTLELEPWEAAVEVPSVPVRPDAARSALVRERTDERLRTLARAVEPGEPRVLVVTHDLSLGGGQLYLHDLMLRLARRGVRFALASPRAGVLVDELEAMGVPVLVTGTTQVTDPDAYEAQVAAIASWAVQYGCTTALANTMVSFAGADAAVRLGLPLTWAIHESYPLAQLWGEAHGVGVTHPYVIDRAQRNLAAARRVVFEADATRRLYEEHLTPGAGVVVPYGVDLEEIARVRDTVDRRALRAELGLRDDSRVLLCVGTVEPRKAQLNLAQAFGGSERLRHEDVELVFVGAVEGSPYSLDLERLVAQMGDPRIRVEPVQRDIARWYHACDVLVCASDVESLPRTMLEAMAFGRPVASTSVYGIPELVEDGLSGWLCRDRDLAALRTMLERVGTTSAQRLAGLGARAREVATTRHDPRVYADFYLEQLALGRAAPVTAAADL